MVCEEQEADYKIKGTPDYYCEKCAVEGFGDIQMLISLEEDAKRLREFLAMKLAPQEEESLDNSDE